MDKETLSNYGWIVICVMVLAVMLAFASPFGNFVADAIKSTTQGLFDVNQGALDSAGIQIMEQEFEQMLNGTPQIKCPLKYGEPYSCADTETGYVFVYKFYEDGSIAVSLTSNGNILYSDTMPVGTAGYDGCNITGTDSESGETIVIGTVSSDGNQVNIDGQIYTLGDVCYHNNTEIKNATNAYTGDLVCSDCGVLLKQGGPAIVIPTGGTYYVGVTSTTLGDYSGATGIYTGGNNFPAFVNDGDVYVYGDYEYRYNNRWYNSEWQHMNYQGGWGVRVLSTSKEAYGSILIEINNKTVNTLYCTFQSCKNLKSSGLPEIPNTIKDMTFAFYGCTDLVTPPTLPNSVYNLTGTFQACTSLTTAPSIPSSVTNMTQTLAECPKLVTYIGSNDGDGNFSNYKLPNRLGVMWSTFMYCTSLTHAPVIPSSVTTMYRTFEGCTSLYDISNVVIPSGVETISNAFQNCVALTTAPVIPSTVKYMEATFWGCTNLTGTITINATPTNYKNCFVYVDMTNVTLAGSASKDVLHLIGNTGKNWTPIE